MEVYLQNFELFEYRLDRSLIVDYQNRMKLCISFLYFDLYIILQFLNLEIF